MKLRAFAGGLLHGIGQGMVAQAQQRREDALERAREERRQRERGEDRDFQSRMRREERFYQLEDRASGEHRERANRTEDREFQLERDRTDFEQRKGLLTREYELKKDLERTKDSSDDPQQLARDKQAWETTVAVFTTKDLNGIERVDWHRVATSLRAEGREDLARRAERFTTKPPGDDEREAASDKAKKEAEKRTSIFSFRSSEFPETKGDKDKWIEQRTQKILAERAGAAGDVADADGQPRQSQSGTGRAPDAAVEYLRRHPELKEQFRAKYGYLPPGF